MKKLLIVVIAIVVVFWGYRTFFYEPDNYYADVSKSARVIECMLCDGKKVCYHCDGEGYWDGRRCSVCNGNGKCDACGGEGELEVIEINNTDYIECTNCHGSGKCGLCGGTGVYEAGYSETFGRIGGDCTLCGGDGECIGCHGEGLMKLSGF